MCLDNPQSLYVPLGSIKQQASLCINPWNKASLAAGAAALGELEDLKRMISKGYEQSICLTTADLCGAAAEAGQLKGLEWLVLEGYVLVESTAVSAAWGGQLEVLQWLRQKRCHLSARVLCAAIAAGPHTHVVDWAL